MANITLKHNPSTIGNHDTTTSGTYYLADNPLTYEIQRSNNFEFVVTGLNNLIRPGATGVEKNAYFDLDSQKVIRLSVSKAPIPHFSQSVITIRRGNNELKYAGVPTFGNGQISVVDYIGADTKSVLMAWQNLSYNVVTEKVGLVEDYKKDCYLMEYSPDQQLVRKWRLYGCWISSISEGDYDAESNDKKMISATIEYDKAKIDYDDLV